MKSKYLGYILLLLILAIVFWWFQIRPSSIRNKCGIEARVWTANGNTVSYDDVYKRCLHENGLE